MQINSSECGEVFSVSALGRVNMLIRFDSGALLMYEGKSLNSCVAFTDSYCSLSSGKFCCQE